MHNLDFIDNKLIKIILVAVGVFLIFVVIYGGMQIYQGKGMGVKIQNPELSQSKPSIEVDPETGWKIYRNEQYGFEFKYPGDYHLVHEGQNILIENNQNDVDFAVVLIDNPLNLTPNEYVENIKSKQNEPEALIVISSKSIQVNGIEGVDVDMTGPGSFRGRSVYFPIKHQNVKQIVNFQYSVDNLFYGDEELYNRYLENGDAIISSLKVNAEIDEPSLDIDPETGWTIYRNEKYGFEIKYPKDWYVYTVSPAEVYLQPDEEQPGNIPGPHASALTITVTPVSLGVHLLDAIETQKKEEGNAGIKFVSEETEIGGTKGLKVKTTCEGVGCGAPEWFVMKGNHLYHFDSNLGYIPAFDQIISTFRY